MRGRLDDDVYRALFEATSIAYLVMTPDLVMIEANAPYLAGVGQSREQLLGRDVFAVFGNNPDRPDVDQAGAVRDSMQRAVRTGRTDRLLAMRYDIPASGGGPFEIRYWNITNTPVLDAGGSTILLLHYTDDITALIVEREANQAAAEVNEQLQERIANAQADLLARASELQRLNARLSVASAHDRSVALTLQQAMLTALPQSDQLQLAARYRAADNDDEVGGDWYDAIVLPSGATALMVGDVAGHDIRAAAVMGQLRSMLRAFVWSSDQPPSVIVTQLDRAMSDLTMGTMATLAVAVVDGDVEDCGSRLVRWTNAGHPSPIVVCADGVAAELEPDVHDVMLGVSPASTRRDLVYRLKPGSTLVLYTDGLTETRVDDIDVRTRQLVRSAGAHYSLDLESMVDAMVADMISNEPGDDVVVLAVRLVS